jgi:predicted nuclease with RNAse H fold
MSFMPMRACANIDPSSSTAAPTSTGMSGDAKRRRESSTRKKARIAPSTTPGMRHAKA